MSRSIDNQETGHLELERVVLSYATEVSIDVTATPEGACLVDHPRLLLDSLKREVGCTDLLGDTTCFTLLNVGLTDLAGMNH